MSPISWVPFYTLFSREIARFQKVIIQTIITPFVTALLYLLIFGVSLGKSISAPSSGELNVTYLAFLIPGLMMMGLLNNAFQNSSSSIVNAKFTGELEDFKIVPLTNNQIIWAMGLASVVRGFVVSLVTYITGLGFYYYQYNEILVPHNVFALVYFVLTGGLIFGFIGISTAFWAKTFDQLTAITAFILTPLIYLGGVFVPLEKLGSTWQEIARGNPLLYLINGLRFGMIGQSDVSLNLCYGIALAALLVFYLGARRSLANASFKRW